VSDDGGLRIATRSSELALRQARLVADALAARGTPSTLVTFKTTGDRNTDKPLGAIGAKGLFTHELEHALLKGRVDCCVHSLKDLPTEMPAGLAIAAVLEREDPRDVLVVNDAIAAEGLADLPRGSRVGTSSLRRRAQLRHARADLEVVELRGNVPTRLHKVDDGQVHAAILAAAGLHRLGVRQRIDAYLEPPGWLPAPGQGAIAVQVRADWAVEIGDLCTQHIRVERLVHVLDRVAQPLARDDPVVERRVQIAEIGRDQDFVRRLRGAEIAERNRVACVRLLLAHRHGLETRGHLADRTDLVFHAHVVGPQLGLIAPAAQRQIAPARLLHGPDAGVLFLPAAVVLALERHPGREPLALAGVRIDAHDVEAETARNHRVDVPRDERDFVVAECNGLRDGAHEPSPSSMAGRRPASKLDDATCGGEDS